MKFPLVIKLLLIFLWFSSLSSYTHEQSHYDKPFKVLILGSSNTGKSSLLKVFMGEELPEDSMPTMGFDVRLKDYSRKKRNLQFNFYDLGAFCLEPLINGNFIIDADLALVLCDITDYFSFKDLSALTQALKGLPVILFANKCDCEAKLRVVTSQELEDFSSENHWNLVEGSAKSYIKVEETLELAAEICTLKAD